jgi:uncharacterized protein YjbI with pentapeptide repeats
MDLQNVYGTIVFSAAVTTIKDLLIEAIKSSANLNGANLNGANLIGANLIGADLSDADLSDANLNGANLIGADLIGANLSRADLIGANLSRADLSDADLIGANLSRADLIGANLSRADLSDANLNRANLYGADLIGANLSRADLSDANLNRANLYGAKNISALADAQSNILPEGVIIGWKKCRNNVIVKLLISAKTPRSNATSRKCRAQSVRVVEVFGATIGISQHDSSVTYTKGQTVTCDKWCNDRWQECAGGIHFYLTRIEAENHN